MSDLTTIIILITLGAVYYSLYQNYKMIRLFSINRKIIIMDKSKGDRMPRGSVPITSRLFIPDFAKVTTLEVLIALLKEFDIRIVLYGDQTLESLGKEPSLWTEVKVAPSSDI